MVEKSITGVITWLKQWFYDKNYIDSNKQDTLVSGTNIKTINNTSLLGNGNINISGGDGVSLACVSDFDVDTDDPNDLELFLDVCQGKLIDNIRKTGTSGNVDTYTITYTDNTTDTFTVTNGSGGDGEVAVIGTGSFSINSEGHLIVELPDGVSNPYSINSEGHLIYSTSGGV